MTPTHLLGRLMCPRWVRWAVFVVGLFVASVGSFYSLLYTDWFQDQVRQRVIAEAESATGGSVEIARFRFDPDRLIVRAEGLVVRTPGPDSVPPFLTVAALELQFGVESVWAQLISLRSMKVESPQVRVVVGADDTTNLPALQIEGFPAGRVASGHPFELLVGKLEISEGRLQWNDDRYPISFASEHFHIHTRYEPVEGRYRSRLQLGESKFEVFGNHPGVSEGEAEFFIYPDRLEAPKIHLAGRGARIVAELKVEQLARPRGVLRYQSTVALDEWADLVGLPLVESGEARTEGEARWNVGTNEFGVLGRLDFVDVVVQGAGTEPISLTADYDGGADQVRIRNLEARVLQGTLAGETTVTGLRSDKPRFDFIGALNGFPLKPVLVGLTSGNPRLTGLPYSGTLSGSVKLSGSGEDDLEATAGLTLANPAWLEPGQTPLEGVVELAYAGSEQTLTLSRFELSTPATRLELQGSITESHEASLRLAGRLKGLDDVVTVARVFGLAVDEVPVTIRGSVAVDGRISDLLAPDQGLVFGGQLQATDFRVGDYPVRSLVGDVRVGPDGLDVSRLIVEDESGSARAALRVDLPDGSDSEGDIELRGLSVEKLLMAAGRTEPLTGSVYGQVRFRGPVTALTASAELDLRNGAAWGEPFDHLRAMVGFEQEKLSVDSLELVHKTARIDAKGRVDTGEGHYQFALEGKNWRLEDLSVLNETGKRVAGNLEVTLHGSGRIEQNGDPFEELLADGSLRLRDVEINGREVGSFSAEVESSNRRVDVAWQGNLFSGKLSGKAEIQPGTGRPYQGEAEIKELDVVHLGQLADIEVQKMTGEVDARLQFSGELTGSNTLAAEGELTRLEVSYSEVPGADRGYELWNPFPMRWQIADNKLDLDQVRLLGDGTDLVLDGSVGLIGGFGQQEDSLDLSLGGIFNLAVLESFRSGLEASGSSTLQANLRGRADEPVIRGNMKLQDGNLRYVGFSNGLNQVSGTLSFDERLVRIEELSAASGGGTLQLAGTVLYGADELDYRLRVDIDRVRVRYPESVSSVLDGQLTYSGTDLRSLLSGNVMIGRVAFGSDVALGDAIASLSEPTRTPASDPVLLNMQLNVEIGSVPDLLIETPGIKNLEAHVNLRLAGTAVQPSLLGDIKIPQGDLLLSGSTYSINRGVIEFYNPFRIEPVVNFELEERIRDVDIALTLSGPASRINLSYRSDPPLRFDELIALLAFSRSPTTDPVLAARETVEGHPYTQSGANEILSNVLSGSGSNRLQRFFGVSRLKVDPRAGGAESNPTARVTTEQQVTKDLTLTYSYDLSSAQQQVIRVEWAPTRQWSFIVTRDENGLVGADVLFKKRLR